jgi:peptidoglycan/LPS O-acetylase OafA/YrhL
MENISVRYFNKIDILRFVAAMMVVFYHAYDRFLDVHAGLPSFLFSSSTFSIGKLLEKAIGNSDFGVDIFFMLSGFLITFLLITEKEKTGKISIKNFYLRRTLRIWPLYFLIVFTAPYLCSLFGVNHAPVYSNALFINNFWTIHTTWWMFPTAILWSICIEEHFYFVWPFLVALINKKRLPQIFLFVIFLSFLYRGYVCFFDNDKAWYKLYLHTFSRMDALALGALTAYYYVQKPFKFKTHWSIRLTAIFTFLFLFCTINVKQWDTAFDMLFKNQIFILLAWFIILQFLFNEKPLIRLPEKSILNYFGKISYGIYMYGIIVLDSVQYKILPHLHQEKNYGLFWLLVISLSIIIPIISYELFEKHFLKLRKRFQVVKQV